MKNENDFLNPINPANQLAFQIHQAELCKDENKHSKAIQHYTAALQLSPNYEAALMGRAQAYLLSRKFERAVIDYTTAINVNINNDLAWAGRGKIFASFNHLGYAMFDFDRAIEINPINSSALGCRGEIYRRQGRLDKAMSDFDRAININPNYGAVLVRRGELYRSQGHLEEAMKDVYRALKVNPHDEVALRLNNNISAQLVNLVQISRAVFEGNIEYVKNYIQKNGEVDVKTYGIVDLRNDTLINIAIHQGHLEIVKLLVSAGAVTTDKTIKQAVYAGHLEILKYLVNLQDNAGNRKFNPRTCFLANDGNYVNSQDNLNTTLVEAARRGHLKIVKFLMNHKDLNGDAVYYIEHLGTGAVQQAVENGHLDIVRYLINLEDSDYVSYPEYVSDPESQANAAFRWAASCGNLTYLEFLLNLKNSKGNPVCDPASDNSKALRWAACRHLDVMKFLVNLKDDQGSRLLDPTAKDNHAIRQAAGNGHLEGVQFLLDLKDAEGNFLCNPAARNNEAIRMAAASGHKEIVELLAQLRDKNGNLICNPAAEDNFAIQSASQMGHLETVKFLAQLKDKDGNPICNPAADDNFAISKAAMYGHQDVVYFLYDILKDRGAPFQLGQNRFVDPYILELRANNATIHTLLFSHMLDGYNSNGNDLDFPPLIAAKITDFSAQLGGETNHHVIEQIINKGSQMKPLEPRCINSKKRSAEFLMKNERCKRYDVTDDLNTQEPPKKRRKVE